MAEKKLRAGKVQSVIPLPYWHKLVDMAEKEGRTISQMAARLLEDAIDARERSSVS